MKRLFGFLFLGFAPFAAHSHDGNVDREPIKFAVRDPGQTAYRAVSARGGWALCACGRSAGNSRFWVAIRDQPVKGWAKPE